MGWDDGMEVGVCGDGCNALDPCSRFLRMQVVEIQMRLNIFIRRVVTSRTDRICRKAPIAQDIRICCDARKLRSSFWKQSIEGRAISEIVWLIRGVSRIAHGKDRGQSVSRTCRAVKRGRIRLYAAIERDAATAAEDISHDLTAL